MKKKELIRRLSLKLAALAAAGGFACAAHGGLYASWSGSQVIPDNNPSGVAYGVDFGTAGLQITDVAVSFTISGGWNGDLYAYLSHDSSGTLVLLNRVGSGLGASGSTLYNYGYSGSGFNNITLSDSGSGSIHSYGGTTLNSVPTANGNYNADGAGGATFYSSFHGQDPSSGNWTLFFADLSGGSVSTLNGWSLNITTVPEPLNIALGIFGGIFLIVIVAKNRRVRDRIRRCRVAVLQWVDAV
jgi:subtilisin-like proprotein convertase family protein